MSCKHGYHWCLSPVRMCRPCVTDLVRKAEQQQVENERLKEERDAYADQVAGSSNSSERLAQENAKLRARIAELEAELEQKGD